MPYVTAHCAQGGKLRGNVHIAIISNAYSDVCSPWATYVFVERFKLQNVLNFNNAWPWPVKFFRCSQIEKSCSKRLKPSACRRLKANREEHFESNLYPVHICLYKESRTKRKSNDEKGGNKQKKTRFILDNEKQDQFACLTVICKMLYYSLYL